MDVDAEVSVKDIVNFFIKINDSSKAKNEIARFSSKDKATALEMIASSSASRDFRIDVARHFIYDPDGIVRRKAEHFMEYLVPGWVSDPAESILKLLKSTDGRKATTRDAAVRFLIAIVDATVLRDTLTSLLNRRNREYMADIVAIVERYIDSSSDERELVKIFDGCLSILVSDERDNSIKHHASNLLSLFFNKVQSTNLGEALRRASIEKQIDKAEAVYGFLCAGTSGLNGTFLDDLLRPLKEGGSSYQIKILGYFRLYLDTVRSAGTAVAAPDAGLDCCNEPVQEEGRSLSNRILQAVDEMWDVTEDSRVHALIIRIRFGAYDNKRELLEQIRSKVDDTVLTPAAREKITLMIRCFLHPEQPDVLKLQAAQLLLSTIGDTASCLAALDYLTSYLENRKLNYAEKGSIATVVESFLAEQHPDAQVRDRARYLLLIADPKRVNNE